MSAILEGSFLGSGSRDLFFELWTLPHEDQSTEEEQEGQEHGEKDDNKRVLAQAIALEVTKRRMQEMKRVLIPESVVFSNHFMVNCLPKARAM